IAIILFPSSGSAFLPSAIRLPGEDGSSRPRNAIEYRDVEDTEAGEADSVREEVNRLNKDSNMASYIEGGRVRARNGLWQEHENWRAGGEAVREE
ncbi:hypothetical protein LTR53_020065, partial [Teratosphaeriaceae sp. CCFEE 6253]